MRKYNLVAAAISIAGSAWAGLAEDVTACKSEVDSLKRLSCFDAIRVEPTAGVVKIDAPDTKAASPITLVKAKLSLQERDIRKQIYSRQIELVPTFKNDTKKTVVALEHTMTITDAFGDKIVDGRSRLDIKIPPGKTVESDLFYSWEDNQFINNEPFDKLLGPVSTGVAKSTLVVTRAVFSDGTNEAYAP